MEEKLYRIEGTLLSWFLAGKRKPLMATGAIVGETEAYNWLKYLQTAMSADMYFRMMPTTIEEARYYQASFSKVTTNKH